MKTFLLAGEDGMRKHSMEECYQNFVSEDSKSQDTYFTVDLNMVLINVYGPSRK